MLTKWANMKINDLQLDLHWEYMYLKITIFF